MEEAGTAHGKLVEGGPAPRWGIGREKIGGNSRDGVGALGLPAHVADQIGEFGAYTGKPGPVARIGL